MKKKHRDIVVDDVAYAWIVYGTGKERGIGIWKDKKEIFYTEVRMPSITPSFIADLIREKKL